MRSYFVIASLVLLTAALQIAKERYLDGWFPTYGITLPMAYFAGALWDYRG